MKDYLKKQPSKSEQMIYELSMRNYQLEQALMTASSQICAMAMQLKVDPSEMAELMVNKRPELEAYATKINEELRKRYEANKGTTAPQAEATSELPTIEESQE